MFQKFYNLSYKILGPKLSTILAKTFLKNFTNSAPISSKHKIVYRGKHGIKIQLTQKESILLGFGFLGVVNPLETKLIERVINNGDGFIDIGAYADGWYTLLSSKLVGRNGHVYSFEPADTYYDQLKKNLSLNKTKNVILEKMAVSNKNGSRTFYVGNKASSFYYDHSEGEEQKIPRKTKVKTTTLDSYCKRNNLDAIKMIKIDVECAEMEVLQGAVNQLKKKSAPNLLIEVIDSHLKKVGSSESKLVKYLKYYGYYAFTIHSSGTKKYINEVTERGTVNLYFSKSSEQIKF